MLRLVIRLAAILSEPYSVKLSRQQIGTNVLVVGAKVFGFELAKMTIDFWLTNDFEVTRYVFTKGKKDETTVCLDL